MDRGFESFLPNPLWYQIVLDVDFRIFRIFIFSFFAFSVYYDIM